MAEFGDDPVVRWAREVAEDPRYRDDPTLEHFLTLTDHYLSLLRRFTRVTRLSDSYQKTLKELNESLNEAARRDHLTGLANRREVLDRLAEQVSRAHRHGEVFAVVLADIDDFKRINDTYGHEAGDQVLRSVAGVFSTSLRPEDTCSRWGGEEFLIALPHTDSAGAGAVAGKLRGAVAETDVRYDNRVFHTTISAGVAEYRDGEDLDDTIRHADDAMFQAKRRGKDRVCVFE
jgi:diguanylate cyclase (GGDEF)-like protein